MDVTDAPVCLFTGASGTLGTAFCRQFAGKYQIAGVHHGRPIGVDSQLSWTVDPLEPGRRGDGAVFAIDADLRDHASIDRIVELTMARFGRIDVVVNAAGLAIWGAVLASAAVIERAQEQFAVNVLTPLRLVARVAEQCWRDAAAENRRRNRAVVNVSSAAGVWVYPGRGQSVYAASKSAQNTISLHLADEFAAIGVRVNALAPDSFPDPVPTSAVADAIAVLIDGTETGQLVVVDQSGAHPV